MKIMHFIHDLSTGGAETLVKDYALNFDRAKNDVVILCFSHAKGSPYEKLLTDAGVRVICVEDYLHFGKIFNKVFRLVLVRKIIRRESPEILHTHLFVNRHVKFAKPALGTKIFCTVHSEPIMLWPSNDSKRRKDFKALKWLLKHYSVRFVVLHDDMKREVDGMFGVLNSIVLNNGVDVSKFKNRKNADIMRDELKIPRDAFVVGHVGRFSASKNHNFLAVVFQKVEEKNKDVILLMVGNGDEKKDIENKLRECGLGSKYLILSNRSDVPDILSAMDVFVFPSLYEGLPISLIEAQEVGLPCFVSDAAPKQSIISNLVTRLPLEAGPGKWAETILNYKKPEKIILHDEDWDIKKITKQLEKIYEEALKEKGNGKK